MDPYDEPYLSDVHTWWHRASRSPELEQAERDGWLGSPGLAVDLGCGLGVDADYLTGQGWRSVGIDLAGAALRSAQGRGVGTVFVRADVRRLPIGRARIDLLADRGCFHYLSPSERPGYAAEAERVLRPGGRLLLRACRSEAGVPNDIDGPLLRRLFRRWRIDGLGETEILSDTRGMRAVVARLVRP